MACRVANRLDDGIDGKLHLGRVNALGFLPEKVPPCALELDVRQLVELAIFVALMLCAPELFFELGNTSLHSDESLFHLGKRHERGR